MANKKKLKFFDCNGLPDKIKLRSLSKNHYTPLHFNIIGPNVFYQHTDPKNCPFCALGSLSRKVSDDVS